MDLFEIDETRRLRREDAAARLHELADALARNNVIEFARDGRRIIVGERPVIRQILLEMPKNQKPCDDAGQQQRNQPGEQSAKDSHFIRS